jgi:translocation and assembly module TamB
MDRSPRGEDPAGVRLMHLYGLPWRDVSGDAPGRRRSLRRLVVRLILGLAGLVWGVVIVLLVVVHGLDQPWLKRHVQALARSSAGVDIDYRSVRVNLLSGATIDGLVVGSPPEVQAFAPDLLLVEHVEARWSPGSLLGHGPAIESLDVSGVALTVVVDERGRTSFDALPQSRPSPTPAPPVPLSHLPASWLMATPPLGKARIESVSLTLVRTEQGRVVERTSLRGLSLGATMMPAAKGWRAQLELGSPAAPLDLGVERVRGETAAGGARASLWFTVDSTSSECTADLDLRVLEQTLVPDLPVADRLHAEARARFDERAARTEVTIDHTDLGQGVATADASIEVPDSGDPVVRHAQGDVDVARLLRWLPAGLVPVTAQRAKVRYRIDGLTAGPVPRLSDGGAIAVDGDVSNVKVSTNAGALEIGEAKVSLHGSPAPGGGFAGGGSVQIASAEFPSGSDRIGVEDLALDLEGHQAANRLMGGHATMRFARVDREGPSPVAAQGGRVDLEISGLRRDPVDPLDLLATRGDVVASLELSSLDARSTGSRALVDGLTVRVHTLLEGHAPYSIELDTTASRVRVSGAGGRPIADTPVHLQTRFHDVIPDLDHPASSRGVAKIAVEAGDLRASLDATRASDAVDFALDAAMTSLKSVVPLLPPDLAAAAPWSQMATTFRSSGHVDRIASGDPSIRQTTSIRLERPAFGNVQARSLSLDLGSHGTALAHTLDADLHVQGLALDGGEPSDDHVTLSATVDRRQPSLRVRIETTGRATSKLSAALSFDRQRHAAVYDIDGDLAGLEPLAPLASRIHGLEGFDLAKLEVGLSARGALLGVVSSVAGDGTVVLEPHPTRTLAVEGTVDLRAAHFHWARGDTALSAPAIAWHGDMHVVGDRRTLDSRVDVDTVHIASGQREIDLAGISDDASATVTGDLLDPDASVTVRAAVRDVHQDAVPEYPVGGVAFALSAERDKEGMVHVSDLKLANAAGGTTLGVSGSLDLGTRRRRLALAAQLTQDLAPLSNAPERFTGRGKIVLDSKIESPDLSLFRTHLDLKADDVHVRMPRAGVEVEAMNGEIPASVAFAIRKEGEDGKTAITFARDEERNPYSMLRFADQHALLSRTGFISVGSIKTPFASIAPLAGNLAIDQNVVSLSQFEMGVRGGRITGQCALDWDGPKSTLELHVRASGVQSSHGEPFDGNVAVVVAAGDRTVEGRAEILKIGPRHLLDLLDMQDPLRVDPAMNRIRSALSFGYPKRLRLVFDHGFASARLELGGLASLVSLGELNGIPMGPIVDKFLDPLFATKAAP